MEDRILAMSSKPYPDAHTVLYDHLKNAKPSVALFDQRSNLYVTLLSYKEKSQFLFPWFWLNF